MKRTFDRTTISPYCIVCGKGATMQLNKPHSMKRTKRVVKPNLQSYMGLPICTRCLRTMKRDAAIAAPVTVEAVKTEAKSEVAKAKAEV